MSARALDSGVVSGAGWEGTFQDSIHHETVPLVETRKGAIRPQVGLVICFKVAVKICHFVNGLAQRVGGKQRVVIAEALGRRKSHGMVERVGRGLILVQLQQEWIPERVRRLARGRIGAGTHDVDVHGARNPDSPVEQVIDREREILGDLALQAEAGLLAVRDGVILARLEQDAKPFSGLV